MSQHTSALAIGWPGRRVRRCGRVDPRTMPGRLQAFVNNSPVTHLSSAVRGLMAGDWPADEIAWSLGWAGLFVAVFGPVTMRLHNRK